MIFIKNIFLSITVVLITFLFFSCSENTQRRLEITPKAYGSVDNIYLVADKYLWNTAVGDSFRMHFEALFPVTPQPEPIFDIRFVESQKFNKVHRTHRAIIILGDLSDSEDAATKMIKSVLGEEKLKRAMTDRRYRMAVQKDRWAVGQSIIYWFAPNREALLESVTKDYQKVIEIINELDAETLAKQVYSEGMSPRLNDSIRNEFKFEMKIPRGFAVAHRDSNTLWLYEELPKSSNNLLMHVVNNVDYKTISRDSIIAIRNRLSKKYFSSWAEGSYMEVDDVNLPIFYQEMLFGESKALQARGIWRMEKDFMGGPFVSYLIPDFKNNRVIFLDAFVYAPGQKKRPEMRKLDTVFSTFKLIET